jgi:hypothetical protein
MIDTQTIDFGILVLAGLFLLVGLILFFRGLIGRDPASLYGVQRQVARRAAYVRLLQGAGLIAVAAVLFFAYLGFQGRGIATPTSPDEAFPTSPPSVSPTQPQEVVRTIPLSQPTLVATQDIALPQVTVISPTETPLPPTAIIVEPTPLPTAEPTAVPTETPLPYDAVVSVIGGLNLRDAPNGNLIVRLDDGQQVNLLAGREAAGAYMWQQITTLDGVSGWVVEDFLVLAK